ncbi:MAG: type IV pilus twitching motility protein PilT [Planctomycetes bacterium]|nr:type IV pilus twitching motility protein PilT [Planctomycetota bacterium]
MEMLDIFRAAVARGASDVLITAGSPPILRVLGDLITANAPALAPEEAKDLIYGILRQEQIAKLEQTRELDFSFTLDSNQRFRGNAFHQRSCVAAAFRLIPATIPNLRQLGLPAVLEEMALLPQGLILVTGPTGHGKSTTQAAMIDVINTKRRAHIITIEDPIEYLHRNKKCVIEQREVGEDTMDFASALRHVLRQNPDVILVGEMRDLESISAALTAAETGHLVLATLHTNDSIQAIDRLLDVFPPHQQNQVRIQLSMCLQVILAQRLVPTARGQSLHAVTEILRNNSAVSHLIRDGKTHQAYTILETHGREGMYTMDHNLKELYLKGVISYDTAKSRMRNPASLDHAAKS